MGNKLRVDTGAVKIEVNDDGEYIVLPFGDQAFPARFFGLLDSFESHRADYERRAAEIDGAELEPFPKARRATAFNLELHQKLKEEVDSIFGPDTCRKVFGGIVPSVELYQSFFEQLTPYFEKYGKERAQKLQSKYSAGRRGNV